MRQKNRMELKVKELNEKLEKSRQKKAQEEEIAAPVYEEQNDGETQKRVSADQPGPSKKKQKKQGSTSAAKPPQVCHLSTYDEFC